ncbi:antA/AntB antirepressor family protein [Klebsiella pneumoniae]|nr:antA/AntB antirepressor family protein [Klebsiella pneumoniae]
MTTQLISVLNGIIGNETTPLVNARDLHEFLNVRRDFSTWIKNRITEYGFLIDTDYVTVQNLRSPNLGTSKSRAQKVTDYHLTLDTAKELAMVERSEKGRQIRRYFIECERQLRAAPTKSIDFSTAAHNAHVVYLYISEIHRVWASQLYPMLKLSESPIASSLYDYINDSVLIAGLVDIELNGKRLADNPSGLKK